MRKYHLAGVFVAALFAGGIVTAPGCTGTQAAYRAAEGQPDQVAYVIAEQYASVLHEAAELKAKPTTPPAAIYAMQKADLAAQPAVDRLRSASDAYTAVKNAQTQAELQVAIDNAVRLIADVIAAVKQARGAP
jgi:hypothetical protein